MPLPSESQLLERAASADRESKYLDFKEHFDPSSDRETIELIKDIVAMANSGGGIIVFGVRNDGRPSGSDLGPIRQLDPAVLTDKIFRYTGEDFSDFEQRDVQRRRTQVAALLIRQVSAPMVFIKPGTHDIGGGRQNSAFSRGTVYFRHGAKSEPCRPKDLQDFVARQVEAQRKAWLSGIRRVIGAKPGTEVAVIQRAEGDHEGEPRRIRVTTEPGAPVYRQVPADESHPYRQTELIEEVNKRLPRDQSITSHDAQAIRAVHDLNHTTAPEFCHKPRYASQQYSDAFVDWIVDRIETDDSFLEDARE